MRIPYSAARFRISSGVNLRGIGLVVIRMIFFPYGTYVGSQGVGHSLALIAPHTLLSCKPHSCHLHKRNHSTAPLARVSSCRSPDRLGRVSAESEAVFDW
jgi:hypothetical protein